MAPLRPDRAAPRAADLAHDRPRASRASSPSACSSRSAASASTASRRATPRASRSSLRDGVAAVPLPAEFTCALLNAQPMGFYSPRRSSRTRKRHGRRGAAGRRAAQRVGLHARRGRGGRDERRCATVRSDGAALREEVVGERTSGTRMVGGSRDDGAPFARSRTSARRYRAQRARAGAAGGSRRVRELGLSRRSALWEVPGVVHDARHDAAVRRSP